MALKGRQCTATAKRTGKRCTNPAVTGFNVCRHHGAGSLAKPGGRPPTHGRYSRLKREELRSLIEEHAADPNPLDIFPELAAARALFQNFIERYDEHSQALIAWHQSYQSGQRPIDPKKADALLAVLDHYEEIRVSEDDLTESQQKDLNLAREYIASMRSLSTSKPIQILDISDAYRIVSEITKIVERIEKVRAANAVSRSDLARILQEMARVVNTYVPDEQALEKIKEGWLSVRI
jgi:ribosome-binding protein aMBF1 (putative translation factor)